MNKKIALIGGGNVGGTLAYIIASKALGNIVILDKSEEYAKGKALDIEQSLPAMKQELSVIGTNSYIDIKGADLVIITAGVPRKADMSRDDLLAVNTEVIASAAQGVKQYAPNAFVIVITNPLDAMVYAFLKYSSFLRSKVVGMAGALDSARLKLFLARELKVSVEDITTFVLGGHGDTMVPLIRYTYIGGIPLQDLIRKKVILPETLDMIIERTRNGGMEIVKLLKTGSAFYAPAAAAVEMAEAYLKDKKQLFPCSVFLKGEYGLNNICMGVPALIGEKGMEYVVEIDFNQDENDMFQKSAKAVKNLVAKMKKFFN